MHCKGCERWRHVVDYGVACWSDTEKTRVRQFRSRCHSCDNAQKREYKLRRRGVCIPTTSREHEELRLREIFSKMDRADSYSHQLEGGIPLTGGWSLATEDYDPTPVPQGCHSCYLRGGAPCITCPDLDVKGKARAARKQGLVSLA